MCKDGGDGEAAAEDAEDGRQLISTSTAKLRVYVCVGQHRGVRILVCVCHQTSSRTDVSFSLKLDVCKLDCCL